MGFADKFVGQFTRAGASAARTGSHVAKFATKASSPITDSPITALLTKLDPKGAFFNPTKLSQKSIEGYKDCTGTKYIETRTPNGITVTSFSNIKDTLISSLKNLSHAKLPGAKSLYVAFYKLDSGMEEETSILRPTQAEAVTVLAGIIGGLEQIQASQHISFNPVYARSDVGRDITGALSSAREIASAMGLDKEVATAIAGLTEPVKGMAIR